MQPQSARYSPLVYIFHGDAERMKRNPGKKWDLYGLRTHSSCPVVQYICEEGGSSGVKFGLELLGQCIPQANSSRNNPSRSNREELLVFQNDGVELKAVLHQRRGPVRCSVQYLSGESPFSNVFSRSRRNRSPEHMRTIDRSERRVSPDRRGGRATENQANNTHLQWYTTSRGEGFLRNIHNSCISNFPAPNQVEMSRDVVDQNMQLSIVHDSKAFDIKFPRNFPQKPAQVSCTSGIYANTRQLGQATSPEEIVRMIKNNCGCFRCRR